MRRDKRGQFVLGAGAIAVIAVFVLIILIILGIVVYSLLSNIILLSGLALILLTLIIGLPIATKNPSTTSWGVLGMFLFVGLSLVGASIVTDNLFAIGGNVYAKPDWARLECAPTDSYEGKHIAWLDQQTLFKCDANTDDCRMKIQDTGGNSCVSLSKPAGSYQICDLNGNNCGANRNYVACSNQESNYIELVVGQSAKFKTGFSVIGEDDTKITIEWRPWKLYRFVGGAKGIVNSVSCDITSSAQAKVRQEDWSGSSLSRTGGEGDKWVNYVNDWNYGPGTNVVTYNGKEAYCTAGSVYDIVELRMQDGSLKKLDPEYEATLPRSGERISGLGNRIASVACCPNEPGCNANFEFEETSSPGQGDACFSDTQCFNAGGPVPIDGKSYLVYQCSSGTCQKSSPISVECTNNAQCSNGQICDLSTTNYGECITQRTGPYCGDLTCQSNENAQSCPTDCNSNKLSCEAEGGTLVVKTEKPWWGDIPGVGSFAKETTYERCLIPHLSIMSLILLVLGIALLIFSIINKIIPGMFIGGILTLAGAIWTGLASAGYV